VRSVLAIDPGPVVSAWIVLEDGLPVAFGIEQTDVVIELVRPTDILDHDVVIERMQSFGMPVGESVFETCYVIGRLLQAATPGRVTLVSRLDVKTHHCHSARAKDSNIRQALLDRFGGKGIAVGTRADQGPLYGIKKDIWSALAIGVYHLDTIAEVTGNPLNGLGAGASEDESPVDQN